MGRKIQLWTLALIPFAAALTVWLSPLSFTPVPWPDDSAFYFAARELFKWPPRWVMLPQAPFEPTYEIFSFNIMPLFSIFLGIGRWVGIDGSFALKFWSLTFWAAGGSLLAATLYKKRLPFAFAVITAIGYAADPTLRWASVIVRPESLVGLCGMAIVLGLTFGFPKRFEAKGLWDPIAALLATAAYAHFNAIHLLFPVIAVFLRQPKRLINTGLRSVLYLSPWILTVLWHFNLFIHQMTLQWKRLAVHNAWLDSPKLALASLFETMGSPETYSPMIEWASLGLWILIFAALITTVLTLVKNQTRPLLPSAAWVIGAAWLWHTKPEVWFTYYLHASIWCFAGVALFATQRNKPLTLSLATLITAITATFLAVDIQQWNKMSQGTSWNWQTHKDYIECIDHELTGLETRLKNPKPFRVWCPTFPDITIELSRRHPDWILTRTNDFWDRADRAVQHGRDVEAVVVAETINWAEKNISAPQSDHPEIQSSWMTWNQHFLNRLWKEPGWKPNRTLCQRGRWQAFLFMN